MGYRSALPRDTPMLIQKQKILHVPWAIKHKNDDLSRVARSKFRKSGFYQDIFFSKIGKNQEFFSEVQEIFISSLKDQISIYFRFIIEN